MTIIKSAFELNYSSPQCLPNQFR